MSASYRRFSSWLPTSTRIGQRHLSSSIKKVRQAGRIHDRADEPSPIEESYKQKASKRGILRRSAYVEQAFNILGRLRFSTSKLKFSAENTTQLAPHVKYHDRGLIYATSGERNGERDSHKMHSYPQKTHDPILNKRESPPLPGENQEDSSDIVRTRLLVRDLRNRSCQPAYIATFSDSKPKTSHVQPFNKPASSPEITNVERQRPPPQAWQVQKRALSEKFGSSGWFPRKRLAPDVLESIRSLNSQSPEKYTTPVLAEQFKVSPEAIRRILRSKWRPNEEEQVERKLRWEKRGKAIWSQMVEIGIKPPKKWRTMASRKE